MKGFIILLFISYELRGEKTMKKNNKKMVLTIILGIVVLICILLFLSFCSKQPDSNPNSNTNTNIETPASTNTNTNTNTPTSSEFKGVNKPALVAGMKAVKWENNEWVEISNPDIDTTWYDYKKEPDGVSSEWANAKTSDGSYWVWIPRYAYKIDNEKVEIIFLQDHTNKDEDSKEIPSEYAVHPAFTNKVSEGGWDTEISGFWISKYEAAKDDSSLVFKPNVYSYNNITIGDAYALSKELPYDSSFPHLIKTSEWGAVAYLAVSPYGRNGVEVSANLTKATLSDGKTTSVTAGGNGVDGLAASEQDALVNNANQSTTGNIYGVYDMAGGLWERVAAYINNGNENLLLNGKAILDDGDPSSSNKYKTVYAYNKADDTNEANYNLNKAVKGDAMFETSSGIGRESWFGDESSFMFDNAMFLHRGGTTINEPFVGIFTFSNTPGQAGNSLGFRCAIVVK